MASYLSFTILDVPEPDRGQGTEDIYDRRLFDLNNLTGVRTIDAPEATDSAMREFVWTATTRSEVKTLRDFINARLGRAIPFWLLAWQRDMNLNADHGAASIALTIKAMGYATHLFPAGPQRRHVAIRAPGLGFHYRRIAAAADNGDGTETITLDTSVADALPVGTLISFMRLCRLDTDEPTIEWSGGHYARSSIPMLEIAAETPSG